jgi:hypothetical protein
MAFSSRPSRSNFFIKLTNWEYWPFGIIQAPFFLYWLWLSLKARSLLFFTASNPSILSGGMMGESKSEVLKMVPEGVKPKTILFNYPTQKETVLSELMKHGLALPVIFKPDLGERGWMVRKIRTTQDMDVYLREIKINFIAQELVELPLEFGVFYVRFPNEEKGHVNSITGKEFLSVTGDGQRTLQELILSLDRARLQWETLRVTYAERLAEIIPSNKKIELVSIGNHCLGTKFLNCNHLITSRLNESFDRISRQVPGFYFGRFDLQCATEEDLQNGNVKIVELNGCGAEPAHIYHPGSSLWDALKVLHTHWKNLYTISIQNHQRGVPYLSLREGRKIYKQFKALKNS